MLKTKRWLIVTFHTNDGVMQFEKIARKNGVAGKLIPVPHDIVVDCGTAWRTEICNRTKVEELIAGVDYDQMLDMEI